MTKKISKKPLPKKREPRKDDKDQLTDEQLEKASGGAIDSYSKPIISSNHNLRAR